MAATSSIEWTDTTWNPVSGCTRASAGCDNCYAVTMTHRLEAMGQAKYSGLTVLNAKGGRHFNGVVRTHDDSLAIPLKWRKPRRVFVNSMSDLFHKDVPFDFIDKVFAVMALTPQHTYQILTKRPERMAEYFTRDDRHNQIELAAEVVGPRRGDPAMGGKHWFRPLPFHNVWLGTSVENQQAADERIPHLLKCPAAVRFLSMEPLLGATNLIGPWQKAQRTSDYTTATANIHWVIVGGESGPKARPMNVEWARSIVRQCKAAGVPVFVKQMGARIELANDKASEWGRGGDVLGWEAEIPHYQGELEIARLEDSKGGDPAEWPEDMRVREFPRKEQIK
jgi:protein gp37